MKNKRRRTGTAVVAAVLVATALAGGALAAYAARSTTAATKIQVTEKNYKLVLAKHSFSKGKVTFVVHNATGGTAHEFRITGPGLKKQIPGLIDPGKTKTLTVTLQKGTYTLECPLHVASGMKTTIKAGGGTGGGSGGTTTSGGTWG